MRIGGKERVGITWTESKGATDDVISKIEKTIDTIQENKEELDYYGGYSGDEEFWAGYDLAFDKAFELIKQEINK